MWSGRLPPKVVLALLVMISRGLVGYDARRGLADYDFTRPYHIRRGLVEIMISRGVVGYDVRRDFVDTDFTVSCWLSYQTRPR